MKHMDEVKTLKEATTSKGDPQICGAVKTYIILIIHLQKNQ